MATAIVAYDLNRGIGLNNKIPWKFSEDLQHFKRVTEGNIVLMGANTYRSIGSTPLPNRRNIVLSHKEIPGVEVKSSFASVLGDESILDAQLFIIGGSQIYQQALDLDIINTIIVTEIQNVYTCDTFFPNLVGKWKVETISKVYSKERAIEGVIRKFTK